MKTALPSHDKSSRLERIPENIIYLREQHGLSQEDLAARCGVSRQTIYKIEKGISYASYTFIYELCRIFKVEASYFLKKNTGADKIIIHHTSINRS